MESMGSRRVRHDEQLSLCVTLGPFGDITQYSWLSPMYTEGIHADKVCFFFFFWSPVYYLLLQWIPRKEPNRAEENFPKQGLFI